MKISLGEISETLNVFTEYSQTDLGNGIPVLAEWTFTWPEYGPERGPFEVENVTVYNLRVPLDGEWKGFIHSIEKDFQLWAADLIADWLNDNWMDLDPPKDYWGS